MPPLDLVLINPPHPALVNPNAQAPLSLLYLAAVAERAGLSVRIVNLSGALPQSYLWRFPQARCFGITGTYLDVEAVNAVAREIRTQQPAATILVGGPIALSADELDYTCINTVVKGEGEHVLADLVEHVRGRFVDGEPCDPKRLPLPARHLWPGPFGGNVFIGGENYFGGGSANLITSRGCPFSCAFCAGPALMARTVRCRQPEAVVAEMEEVATDFGVRQFRLNDEFFTAKRSHCFSICALIRQSRILGHGKRVAWRASVGVNPHDIETWKTMVSAGCKEVSLGVETADPKVLRLLTNKGSVPDAMAALETAHEAGLRTRALMMVGLPGSTMHTLQANLRFLDMARFDALAMTVFTPIPGCAIAREPERFGCRILEKRVERSLCMYGPDGENQIRPTIEVNGLSDEEFMRQMQLTVAAAEATGKMGKG